MNYATTLKNNEKGWSNKEENVPMSSKRDNKQESRKAELGEKLSKNNSGQRANNQIPENVLPLLEKLRKKLLSRGGKGIIGLNRQFKIFDDNNSKTLQLEEFSNACKDFKIDLNSSEIKILFNAFDLDKSGSIDYQEFLRHMRGEMNSFRRGLVLRAFDKLDNDKSGVVKVNDLKYVFNVKNNPDVKSGRKTEEEVYGEFIETFEIHHNINKGSRDKRVTKEEFIEYYNNVSCSIDDDKYFETMMINAWKLGAPVDPNKNREILNPLAHPHNVNREKKGANTIQKAPFGTVNTNVHFETTHSNIYRNKDDRLEADNTLMKLRDILAARGSRGIFGLRRTFLIHEDSKTKTIKLPNFTKIIDIYRLSLNKDEATKLFKIFDVNKSGDIDYEELLRGIVGEMNNFRRALVTKAFRLVDRNNNGVLEPSDLKESFNARQHPEVRNGRKTEEEVFAEFLDNFEYHFGLLVNFLNNY